jgi:hypothetical protein
VEARSGSIYNSRIELIVPKRATPKVITSEDVLREYDYVESHLSDQDRKIPHYIKARLCPYCGRELSTVFLVSMHVMSAEWDARIIPGKLKIGFDGSSVFNQ